MPQLNHNDHFQKMEERAREARLVRRIVFCVVLALVVIIAGAAASGYFYVHNALQPVNPDSHKKIRVKIPSGSSVEDIAHILDQKGVINSALVFHYYIKYKNAGGFKAGMYAFSPSMSIDTIIDKLESGEVAGPALKLTFPEGLWMTKVADIIASQTDLDKSDILSKMKDRDYIRKTYMSDYPFLKDVILKKGIRYPLEGYLFPATYSFSKKNPSLEDVIRKMLDKTGAVLQDFQPQIKKSDMSIHEVLTLASMIQEEGTNQENRRGISSVLHNRLKKDMPLQSDPTVDYALKEHHIRLLNKELDTDSPYNTYANKGLPIGPIANPGKKSIDAALNPAHTDNLYFYGRPNGKVEFAKTYDQFLKIKHKYQDEWLDYKKKHKGNK
ncbi:MAG TPA: endolytic transglycosylase MltG [Bacillales bacterium]|nr:endolytic transglycosylase MltG [Bacillales bacterium]